MPRGKAIMVQGTGSHVGKSVLATALCRILRQDGYRVAPFKAQNMSNNAAVCADGGEIGRAQAEQAAACGIEPTTAMNPILLKPSSDIGSQVVVMGRATETMTAKQYQAHKMSLLPKVQGALESLLAAYDLVVIEGAGSPAEINLKAHDIVNMRMAALANAAVLLVGDIDKGGVFAQLVGTFELLDDDERRRVRGLVINKFRGDLDILTPGLDFLERRLQRPVLGVVPYLHELRIAQEDTIPDDLLAVPTPSRWLGQSVRDAPVRHAGASPGRDVGLAMPASTRPGSAPATFQQPRQPCIHIIRHPRIANFTDFEAFGSAVRYISEPADDLPDAIILPGTKSTIADLRRLREAGFEPWLRRARQAGVEIVGICGGFQMLGRTIVDPNRVESSQEAIDGLGLLGCHTVFQTEKETARIKGVHIASGEVIEGYEIHMGCTQGNPGPRPLFRITERHGIAAEGYDGVASPDGRVWGTYLHGLFDSDGFREWWLERLLRRRVGQDCEAIAGPPQHEGEREGRRDGGKSEWAAGIRLSLPRPLSPSLPLSTGGSALAEASLSHPTCGHPKPDRFDALAAAVRKAIDVEHLYRIIWG